MSNKIKTINPTTGKEIASYQYLSKEDLEEKIQKAHATFLDWRHKSLNDRATLIKAIGKSLQDHKDALANLMTEEMGKLLSQSHQEVDLCSAICEYTASKGQEALQDEERELVNGGKGIVTYQPIGVVYGIQPWNYPAYQVIRYAIASLMAGNAVLLKHASNVTGCGQLLEKIVKDAGVPEYLFQALIIDHDQSDAIIEHKLIRGVTLTGSSGAGSDIGQKASAALKKVVLELGSNDAYIVLEDAVLELAVEKAVKGRIYNNGETCIAAKRFVVVDAIYEQFKDAFVKEMEAITTGDPTNDEVDLGPMAREDLRETLHEQVQKSVDEGAKILCGGAIEEGEGYFYPATVLDNVSPGQPAYGDELFGPVASLIKARDADDAMRIANDSKYGLGGGIFSKDEQKAKALARDYFDTGMVFINSFGLADPAMPFGGVKDSGFGREHGGFGIKEFVNVKSLIFRED